MDADTHADTCAMGNGFRRYEKTDVACSISAYTNSYKQKILDISQAYTAFDHPSGEVYILDIFHGLDMIDKQQDPSLFCPNQLRYNYLQVKDTPNQDICQRTLTQQGNTYEGFLYRRPSFTHGKGNWECISLFLHHGDKSGWWGGRSCWSICRDEAKIGTQTIITVQTLFLWTQHLVWRCCWLQSIFNVCIPSTRLTCLVHQVWGQAMQNRNLLYGRLVRRYSWCWSTSQQRAFLQGNLFDFESFGLTAHAFIYDEAFEPSLV